MAAAAGPAVRRGALSARWLLLAAAIRAAAADPGLRGSAVEYVVVFDAGSSGTRVHVFSMLPEAPGASVPNVDIAARERQTKKVKPGLSHYALQNNSGGARDSIASLMKFADTVVPETQRAATPVLLKATAGLRAVPEGQAKSALQQVRGALGASGYLFRDEWASIIPGSEEGGLAWVAANYLRGTFQPGGRGKHVGIIELGGGSMQVAFLLDAAENVAEEDRFVFKTLVGDAYRLYAHSYQGFGQDHAQAMLQAEHSRAGVTQDPCYQEGYTPSEGSAPRAAAPRWRGKGDVAECTRAITSHVLLPASPVAPGSYAGEVPLRGNFVATENFAHARKDLGLEFPAGLASVAESAASACGKPHDGKLSPGVCFAFTYQAAILRALLARAVGEVHVEVVRQVGGADADWALGAAIVHAVGLRSPEQAGGPTAGEHWTVGMYFANAVGLQTADPQLLQFQSFIFVAVLFASAMAARTFYGAATRLRANR